MNYKFYYYFTNKEDEKTINIEADNDREAVMKLFDKVGICEFGCIKADGNFFSDEKFPKEKILIKMGV